MQREIPLVLLLNVWKVQTLTAVLHSGAQKSEGVGPYIHQICHFETLPIEVRLIIWKLCVETRRVSNLAKIPGNKVPTVLHLCHESRKTTISSYTRFAIIEPPVWSVSSVAYDILFNYDTDELFLHIPSGAPAMNQNNHRRVNMMDQDQQHQLAGLEKSQYELIQRISITEDIALRTIDSEDTWLPDYRAPR
jgi:hypothetical protein